MAHVSTKLLRETYQAFAGGDLEPLLGALTDDISWHDSRLGPLAGHCTGKDQVLGLFAKMTEVYGETLRLEVAGIFADDDRGVVLTREAATAEGEQLAWTSAVGDLAVSRRAPMLAQVLLDDLDHPAPAWRERRVATLAGPLRAGHHQASPLVAATSLWAQPNARRQASRLGEQTTPKRSCLLAISSTTRKPDALTPTMRQLEQGQPRAA